MAVRKWLDLLEQELVSADVSGAYRSRLLEEYRDHVEDIYCEERNHAMSAEAFQGQLLQKRLGHPKDVAKAVDASGVRPRFARRHPLVTYLLFPIPTLFLLWIAYFASLAGIFQMFEGYRSVGWAVSIAVLLAEGLAYIPAILLTVLIAWVATRSDTRVSWWLASSALVALISGMLAVHIQVPTTPGTGSLNVGLAIPPSLASWPQMAIPLAITMAFVGYGLWRRRSLSNAQLGVKP